MTPFALYPPPGINSDDTTFSAEGRWVDGDGFRFLGGRPETVTRTTSLLTGLAANTTKMLAYVVSGTVRLAVAGDTLERTPAASSAFDDITPASGWAGGRHSLAMWGDVLLASVSGGKLFQSAAGAQATEITQSPDAITCMVVTPSRQVMALGCNEETSGTFNGRCIRWSDIEDNTDWTTTATNNAGEYILPGQQDIVGGAVFGDYILIWTQGTTWLAQFTGDPAQTFTFQAIGPVGLIAQDAFAILHNTVYWMAAGVTFHAYSLGSAISEIPCPISREIKDLIAANFAATAFFFASTNARFGEVWFNYSASGAPTHYAVYCVDESRAAQSAVWFKGTWAGMSSTLAAVGAMIDNPLLTRVSASQFGAANATMMASEYGGSEMLILDTANIGPFASYIQTADQYIDQSKRRFMITRIVPDFEEQGGNVALTIYTRDYPQSATVTTKGPYTLTVEASGYLVNDTVASGDAVVTVDTGTGGIAAGRTFTFAGVNEWADGADTGSLMIFTVSADYAGGNGNLSFTPAAVSTGGSRNVVALPANNAAITVLGTAAKKDFRASGKIMAVKFAPAASSRLRIGKPVFDVIPTGQR